MPTAEVLCTHQGVSQSRGKSSCPAQGSPVFVINNPDLKCGYCFQCIHQLEKQKKNMQNYSFLILSISFALKPATPAICVRGGGGAHSPVLYIQKPEDVDVFLHHFPCHYFILLYVCATHVCVDVWTCVYRYIWIWRPKGNLKCCSFMILQLYFLGFSPWTRSPPI